MTSPSSEIPIEDVVENSPSDTPAVKKRPVERKYSCDQCTKKFKYTSHLKVHQVTHSPLKPYLCPVCERSFKHRSSMATHLHVRHYAREKAKTLQREDSQTPSPPLEETSCIEDAPTDSTNQTEPSDEPATPADNQYPLVTGPLHPHTPFMGYHPYHPVWYKPRYPPVAAPFPRLFWRSVTPHPSSPILRSIISSGLPYNMNPNYVRGSVLPCPHLGCSGAFSTSITPHPNPILGCSSAFSRSVTPHHNPNLGCTGAFLRSTNYPNPIIGCSGAFSGSMNPHPIVMFNGASSLKHTGGLVNFHPSPIAGSNGVPSLNSNYFGGSMNSEPIVGGSKDPFLNPSSTVHWPSTPYSRRVYSPEESDELSIIFVGPKKE